METYKAMKGFLVLCAFTYLNIAKFLKCAFKETFQQAESASHGKTFCLHKNASLVLKSCLHGNNAPISIMNLPLAVWQSIFFRTA
jgi:hypothetical protein